MATVSKRKAIRQLKEAVRAAKGLLGGAPGESEVRVWHERTLETIEFIFGNDHRFAQRFSQQIYSLPISVGVPDVTAAQKIRLDGLWKAITEVEELIKELKERGIPGQKLYQHPLVLVLIGAALALLATVFAPAVQRLFGISDASPQSRTPEQIVTDLRNVVNRFRADHQSEYSSFCDSLSRSLRGRPGVVQKFAKEYKDRRKLELNCIVDSFFTALTLAGGDTTDLQGWRHLR